MCGRRGSGSGYSLDILAFTDQVAAATYTQPTYELAWPFGLGELHTDIEWDADTVRPVDIVPDK